MRGEASRSFRQRRALNIIWTAAGDYGFRPEFMAFHRDGSPDLYLNSILGFVHRHYDGERLSAYLHTFDDSLLRDLFTDLFWIGLEQAAYERELPFRPALRGLRQEHARRWLSEDVDLSMQQLMMRSEVLHAMKKARCREILGESPGLRNPWDKALYSALRFSGDMETEELIQAMQGVWKKFFLFHFSNFRYKKIHLLLSPRLTAWLRKCFPHRQEEVPESSFRLTPMAEEGEGAVRAGDEAYGFSADRWEKREEELEERFGPSLFGRAYMEWMEQEYCRETHGGTHLWITEGKKHLQPKNLSWLKAHHAQYRTMTLRIRDRLRNALALCRHPMDLEAEQGFLRPGRVWRVLKLRDQRIFSSWEEMPVSKISLLLLLDASASRESQQERIACEAYALAEGVRQAGIPIAIVSFCSFRGCTVLERLKGFHEADGTGALRYFARGWNRDGLALRAVTELLKDVQGKPIVAVLTDAYPSDEASIPGSGMHLSERYLQEPAVEDTAKAVRELRHRGIRVVGLIHSVFSSDIIEGYAKRIYGSHYVRIQKPSQLADAVGGLLEGELV